MELGLLALFEHPISRALHKLALGKTMYALWDIRSPTGGQQFSD